MNDIILESASAKDLTGIYGEIAEEFDVHTAYRVYQCFKGLQLTFPLRFYSNECIYRCISSDYNGSNVKELARKYGFSERRIRQIISLQANSN